MEMWKEIDGMFGLLEISNYGRVRSNMRDGRILKQQIDTKGYFRIRVTIKGKKKSIKVHREVAKAFIQNPNNLPQVNHIDGNKANNCASNLEWVTNKSNADHAIENGLWENVYKASKATNEKRKTPITSVDEKTGEKKHFKSVSEAERFFGSRHISDVLNGKRERAAGQFFYRG